VRKSDTSYPALPGLWLTILTLAAGFLLLWRLDRPLLWQDEAETANVAVNLLHSGVPTPWDGDHLVTQQQGRDALRVGDRLLWAWHPWPQHYLAAAGLALAGEGATPAVRTIAARLPFALLALVTVPLVYGWRRRRDGWAGAAVATAIYALSIGFVLYARQCRYYALLYLGGLIALWAYGALGRKPAPTVALALGLTLVFYANPLSGVALGAGLGIHTLIVARERLGATLRAGALFALLAAPWLALIALSEVRAPARGVVETLHLLAGQLWRFQYTLLPAVLWPVLAWTWWRARQSEDGDQPAWRRRFADEIVLLAVLAPTMLVVVSLQAPLGTARYLLPLWPLCAAVLAGLWRRLHDRSAIAGALYLTILLATDLLPSLPATPVAILRPGPAVYDREASQLDKLARNGRIGVPLADFLSAQTDPERGPITALVTFAEQLPHPPRVIVAAYGWESLHFYLGVPATSPDLQRRARATFGLSQLDPEKIDLVIPRRGWPRPDLDRLPGTFVPITLPTPDDAYENLPDLTGARFHPSDLPPLRVWVRKQGPLAPLAPRPAQVRPLRGARPKHHPSDDARPPSSPPAL